MKQQLTVLAVVGSVCAFAAWQVLSKPRAPGHDTFSSEKPQQLRGETLRNLEQEKARVAEKRA